VGVFLVVKVLGCLVLFRGGPVGLRVLTECVFGSYSSSYAKRVLKVLRFLERCGLVSRCSRGCYRLVNFPFLGDSLPFVWSASNIICSEFQYPKDTVLSFDEFLNEREKCHVKCFEEGFNVFVEFLRLFFKSVFDCDLDINKLLSKINYVQLYIPREKENPILRKFNLEPGSIVHVDFRHSGSKTICEDSDLIAGIMFISWIFTEIASSVSRSCDGDSDISLDLALASFLISRALSKFVKKSRK